MSAATSGDGTSAQVEPDAFGRGWIEQVGATREQVLFVLSSTSLGVKDLLGDSAPDWYDLQEVRNLDALGEPVDGMQTVEMEHGGRSIRAGWPVGFCDSVVGALQATLAPPGTSAAPSAPAPAPAPVVPAPVVPAPVVPAPVVPAPVAPVPEMPALVASPHVAESPAAPTGAAALVLEDVTYLGGYPGQNKKRKKCTATLTRDAVEVAGPNGLAFRVPWEVVRTIEAQNADEARFRMNTKVHRDATALVLECDQDVTVLLEARDCPTIPLRGAIAQLVDGLPVVVV